MSHDRASSHDSSLSSDSTRSHDSAFDPDSAHSGDALAEDTTEALTEEQVKRWVDQAQTAHQDLSAELHGISRQ